MNTYTVSVTWSVEDVLEVRPDLTKEQAIEVLNEVVNKHDASIGINWDVIRATANMMY